MTVLGCIADDFTGATDLAGILARSGVRVRLHTGLPSAAPTDGAATIEVIALKIRTAPVAEAVEQARAALAWLRRAGAKRYFWKYCSTFDSTAAGNIGPVSEALMNDLGVRGTVYCPAFPENGRRVFMGNLFVNQTPLAESPMKDHPLTPMRDSNLMRLLQPQVTKPAGLVDLIQIEKGVENLRSKIGTLFRAGVEHVILDALNDNDLKTIATACRDLTLITGGSAVVQSLPDLYLKDHLFSNEAVQIRKPVYGAGVVVLSGSASAMTNQQVADYSARGVPAFQLDPLELARNGHQRALDWLEHQNLSLGPLIYATTAPGRVREVQEKLGIERAGEIVETALAAAAVKARDLGVGRIIVAGGETSGAVTKALSVQELEVGIEIAPGVPWCFCESNGKRIALTLKSGNFGKPSFFSDAIKLLESA